MCNGPSRHLRKHSCGAARHLSPMQANLPPEPGWPSLDVWLQKENVPSSSHKSRSRDRLCVSLIIGMWAPGPVTLALEHLRPGCRKFPKMMRDSPPSRLQAHHRPKKHVTRTSPHHRSLYSLSPHSYFERFCHKPYHFQPSQSRGVSHGSENVLHQPHGSSNGQRHEEETSCLQEKFCPYFWTCD